MNEDEVAAPPTAAAPTTSERSTRLSPTKVWLILEVCRYSELFDDGIIVALDGPQIFVWKTRCNRRVTLDNYDALLLCTPFDPHTISSSESYHTTLRRVDTENMLSDHFYSHLLRNTLSTIDKATHFYLCMCFGRFRLVLVVGVLPRLFCFRNNQTYGGPTM